jgi:hypothetical protein
MFPCALLSPVCSLALFPHSLSLVSLSYRHYLHWIMPRWNRTVVLVTSFIGALFNTLLAIQLFALWRSLRWDSESEWEGSLDPWTVKSLSILGGLLAAYFVTAAIASSIGFAGIFKVCCSALVMRALNSKRCCSQSVPPYIRFYRDFSVADFTFCTISTLFVTYASFSYYSVRSRICEELSRHGDLMRDLAEIGLSPENCEQWFERVVLVFVGVMLIVMVVRVSFCSYKYQQVDIPGSHIYPIATFGYCSFELLSPSIPSLERSRTKSSQRWQFQANLPSPEPHNFSAAR